MLKRSLAVLCFWVFGAVPATADGEDVRYERVLADFAQPEIVAQWRVADSSPGLAWKYDADLRAAVVEIPDVTNPDALSPVAVADLSVLDATDWVGVEGIAVEIHSETDMAVPFRFGMRFFAFDYPYEFHPDETMRLQKGWQTFIQPITGSYGTYFKPRRFPPSHLYLRFPKTHTPALYAIRRIGLVGQPLDEQATRIRRTLASAALRDHPESSALQAKIADLTAAAEFSGHVSRDVAEQLQQWEQQSVNLVRSVWMERARERDTGNRGFDYAVADSMEAVFFDWQPFLKSPGGEVALSLGRGEAESAQIVLLPVRNIESVSVQVERGPGLDIRCDPVGYVNTEGHKHYFKHMGWYPYIILEDWEPIELVEGRVQPYWLTVRAPGDARAGHYEGAVLFDSGTGDPLRVPFRVRVRDFELPEFNSLPFFNAWSSGRLANVYSDDAESKEAFHDWLKGAGTREEAAQTPDGERLLRAWDQGVAVLADHRMGPDVIYRRSAPSDVEMAIYNNHPARWFCIRYVLYQPDPEDPSRYDSAALEQVLADIGNALEQMKELDAQFLPYVYGFDEISAERMPVMRHAFSEIRKRWPDLPLVTTASDRAYGEKTETAGLVDLWIPLTKSVNENAEAYWKAQRAGKGVGYYVCLAPGPPYANVFVESAPIESRLLTGLMAWGWQSDAFLYYAMNRWVHGETNEPFDDPITEAPLTGWHTGTFGDHNGDGNLLCAGPDGPLPTLQLANLRDGLEDHLYATLLKAAVEEVKTATDVDGLPADWLRRAEKVLDVPPAVMDLTEFSREPGPLRQWREEAGELLDQYESRRS